MGPQPDVNKSRTITLLSLAKANRKLPREIQYLPMPTCKYLIGYVSCHLHLLVGAYLDFKYRPLQASLSTILSSTQPWHNIDSLSSLDSSWPLHC